MRDYYGSCVNSTNLLASGKICAAVNNSILYTIETLEEIITSQLFFLLFIFKCLTKKGDKKGRWGVYQGAQIDRILSIHFDIDLMHFAFHLFFHDFLKISGTFLNYAICNIHQVCFY